MGTHVVPHEAPDGAVMESRTGGTFGNQGQVRMWVGLEGRCHHNGRRRRSVKVFWRKTCVECASSDGQPWSMWSLFVENAMSFCGAPVLSSFSSFFTSKLEVNLLS